MMSKNIKTVGLSFVESLADKDMTKDKLFGKLYKVLGKDCDLNALRLPSSSAIVSLESNKAKFQIKTYEKKIAGTFNKLNESKKTDDKKALLDVLNILTAKPRDYAVIALDSYLKMDKKNTIDGFYQEYSKFAEQQNRGTENGKTEMTASVFALRSGAEIA